MAEDAAPVEGTDTDTDTDGADNALADARDAQQQSNGQNGNEPDTGTESSDTDWKAEAAKWKALARKHEGKVKELSPLAAEAKKRQDAEKTESQRLQEQLDAAQIELTGYRVSSVRQQAAAKVGLPADMAQFITATEEDAALDQAKMLLSRMAPTDLPAGNFRQGTRQTPPQQMSKNQLFHALVNQNR
jgi:hypothetical protein